MAIRMLSKRNSQVSTSQPSHTSQNDLYTPSLETIKPVPEQPIPALVMEPLLQSVSDMMITIFGTGAMALPFAFSVVGLALGTFICLLSMITTWFSLRLLVWAAKKSHAEATPENRISLASIARIAYGRNSWVFDLCIAVAATTYAVSYLVSICDVFPDLMQYVLPDAMPLRELFVSRQFALVLSTVFVCPIVYMENYRSLRSVTIISWSTFTFLVITVMLQFTTKSKIGTDLVTFKWDTADCIPLFVFALSCHLNLFDNDSSFKSDRMSVIHADRLMSVIDISIVVGGVLYLLIGFLGVIPFGIKTNMIILNNCNLD